jgi:hypothetical protein
MNGLEATAEDAYDSTDLRKEKFEGKNCKTP